jgi:hypothetical protein
MVIIERYVAGAEQLEFGGQSKPRSGEGHWVREAMTVMQLSDLVYKTPGLRYSLVNGPYEDDRHLHQ